MKTSFTGKTEEEVIAAAKAEIDLVHHVAFAIGTTIGTDIDKAEAAIRAMREFRQ